MVYIGGRPFTFRRGELNGWDMLKGSCNTVGFPIDLDP